MCFVPGRYSALLVLVREIRQCWLNCHALERWGSSAKLQVENSLQGCGHRPAIIQPTICSLNTPATPSSQPTNSTSDHRQRPRLHNTHGSRQRLSKRRHHQHLQGVTHTARYTLNTIHSIPYSSRTYTIYQMYAPMRMLLTPICQRRNSTRPAAWHGQCDWWRLARMVPAQD